MGGLTSLLDFVVWYYTKAIIDMLGVWFNFMWFITHFFSIPLLFRTLFSPWKRMTDTSRSRTIEDFFEAVVMNVMSRVFGAIVRFSLILLGFFALCLGVLGLCIALVCWLFSPLLILFSFCYGISLLFV